MLQSSEVDGSGAILSDQSYVELSAEGNPCCRDNRGWHWIAYITDALQEESASQCGHLEDDNASPGDHPNGKKLKDKDGERVSHDRQERRTGPCVPSVCKVTSLLS